MKAFTIRLIPGDNLQDKLKEFVQKEKLTSGNVYCMIPACGTHLLITGCATNNDELSIHYYMCWITHKGCYENGQLGYFENF